MVFGIPASPSLAILLAALTIHGLPPGPTLFLKHKEFFWTIVGAMYVGNVILLILNLPLVGVWARIAYIPYKLLAPIMLGLSLIGTFAIRNDLMDCMIAIIFGVFGYVAKNLNWPTAPLIMGFILGPMLEAALRSTLSISGGSMLILLSRPISLIFVILTIVVVFLKMFFQKAEPKEAD
jgi:putative tricarboxylic transport membrane protein